ncbi:peptidase S1 and S6 chymotrypsin/Hap [Caldalkalibacillus thermarum TA2.A1]|uniref:Peptidase S1 and S6 chymotrypsin/Hap n=1 Tax=Caldalkalibacillus thermarum (strain TA2.A1) TaxID=986075 RepID=F5L8E0_CALTT|nr:trypsin-like peptidase domain-containing protein [Caldalkalibacillus thermarum]EGL82373.1 peptidase S1 and S6 chymotrypsin/Hap [Caldalkalibacillus thermarum TA2.A1]QZT34250.1 trypsin-like peptidase domain-containing protein [Caldalkalibacillus thermarum TA2.A1]
MGFYDEGFNQSPRKRQPRTWLVALVSAVIGGLVAGIMLPLLADAGLISGSLVNEAVNSPDTPASTGPTQYQRMSVEVTSDITEVVEKVSDAIVGVVNIQQTADFFQQDIRNVERGTGSGIIFEKKDGKAYIVTNFHVIQGAKEVEVSLANGERVPAELVGADPLTDLAVLSIDGQQVDTVAEFGDSDAIRTGEPAIAIGNPLGLEFSRTVTMGIISAKERSIEVQNGWELNVIQTDAAINPGNSGGALVNIAGQVIGINSLKIAEYGMQSGIFGTSGTPIEGMGFAIPINDAIPVIEDLMNHGQVLRPQMGIDIIDLASIDSYHWYETLKLPRDVTQGVVVRAVRPMSAADKAGLQERDVIVAINGEEIANGIELRKYLYNKTKIGQTIEVKFYRDGLPMTAELTLEQAEPIEQ